MIRPILVREIPNCTWELEGDTFYCTHEDWHRETTEVDTMRNGEHDTYETPIAVCDDWDCEQTLDLDPMDLYDEPDYE